MNNSSISSRRKLRPTLCLNLGQPILGRLRAIILFGLYLLSLAGCGGAGELLQAFGGGPNDNMQITPPSSGNGPDLVIQSTSVSNANLTPGERFTLSFTVRNQGNRRAFRSYRVDNQAPRDSIYYTYHRSHSLPIVSTDPSENIDVHILFGLIDPLDPSETATRSVEASAPSTPGTYFYGACVQQVNGESNTTNNCSGNQGVRVTVRLPSGRPDLVIQLNSVSDNSLTPGQPFTLSITVRNQGNGRAPATTLRYKRHALLPIVSSDPTVGTDSVPSLDPSRTSSQSIRLTAPSTPGTYHYGACLDSVSGESNTNNNCSGDRGALVTVRAPQTNWGAIYFSFNGQGAYNWELRYRSSRSEAENSARNACRDNGGRNCQRAVSTAQCGALAVGSENGRVNSFSGGSGFTISEAERDAVVRCRNGGGENCRIDSSRDGSAASFCAK